MHQRFITTMATARQHLTDTSKTLRVALAALQAVDEGVVSVTVNLDTLPMAEAAARVKEAGRVAAKEATAVLGAARAAEAAASRAAKAVDTANAAAFAAAKAAKVAEAAARAAEAAAAVVEPLHVTVEARLPCDRM